MASEAPHPAPQLKAAAPELTPEQAAAAERVRTLIQENLHNGHLSLQLFNLSDLEAIALAEALKSSCSITIRVSLGRNNISEGLKKELEEIAKSKGIYRYFYVSF